MRAGRDAVFLDAALEMRGDGDDEAGAAEEEAVGPAGEPGEKGLGADAGIADEFVDLDDEGAAAQAGDEGGREEEEGVALVDEAAAVPAGEAEIPEEGGDVVEELDELEEAAREEPREARERVSRERPGSANGEAPAVWRGSMPVGLERMTRWPIFSKARTIPEMWTASAPVPRVRKW